MQRELCSRYTDLIMITFATVAIIKGFNNILPWRMMQIHLNWTFTKLFDMAVFLGDLPEDF